MICNHYQKRTNYNSEGLDFLYSSANPDLSALGLAPVSSYVGVRSGQCFGQWSVSLVSAVSGFFTLSFSPLGPRLI